MTVAPSSVTLSDYLGSMRRLLHDPNDVFWSLADKTLYINESLQQRDIDTGGQRFIGTFTLVVGTTTYSFTTLSTAFTNPTGNIFDIVGITLLYNGYRILLDERPYSELIAPTGYLAYQNTTNYVQAWARYGSQSIIIAPSPSVAWSIEIDATIYSTPTQLAALTDADAVQFPYTYPVPLYACYLAKQNERQFDEAGFFKDRYDEAVNKIMAARTGISPSLYPRGR